ncbi:MAG: hypothetical protein ACKJSK_21065, partial [Roseibacillus sp.]
MKNSHRILIMPFQRIGLAMLIAAFGLIPAVDALGKVYKSGIDAHWSADNSHFWYRNELAKGQREFVLVDLKKGIREQAFDHERLAKALVGIGAKGIEAGRLSLDHLKFDLPRNIAIFRANGHDYSCDLKSYKLTQIEKPKEASNESSPGSNPRDPAKKSQPKKYRVSREISPDGKWRAYLHEHNVYVR